MPNVGERKRKTDREYTELLPGRENPDITQETEEDFTTD